MDKEPKKPQDQEQPDDIQNVSLAEYTPLTVLISGIANSDSVFSVIFHIAEALVVFYLAYQIVGKVIFTALVVTPLLVAIFYNCFKAYDIIMNDGYDGWDDGDNSSDDDDPHFGDHFNNNLKG